MVRTAWAGRGGGGSGRLYEDSGFAVEAYEYVGEAGKGTWEGEGDGGRPEAEAFVDIVAVGCLAVKLLV